jgi:small subunit ribosomal protein S29
MLAFKSLTYSRKFTTCSFNLAAAATRKSFNKKNSYDKSKNRKGSGNDKSFQDTILTKNYKKSALKVDEQLINDLPIIDSTNKDLIKNTFVKYPESIISKLHVAGSFKPHQYNELYSQPLTLFRENEDTKLLEIIDKSVESSTLDNRFLINGQSGIGKSTILSHFQTFALSKNNNDAILFPISNADLLVNGSNDFKLNPETKKYDQPMYTKSFLKKFKNLNADSLSKIPLSNEIIPITNLYKKSTHTVNGTLLDFVNYILKASSIEGNTTFAFTTILEQLSKQDKLPVYLTIDNFSAFIQYGITKYRDTENRRIYFQNFTVADLLLQYVSGEKTFQKGAIMIATHGNHRLQNNGTLDVISGIKPLDDFAYAKQRDFDYQLANRLLQNNGLQNFNVSKFNLDECKSLVNHLFKFNLIHNEYDLQNQLLSANESTVVEKIAAQKYFISGNGNPKLIMDSCILAYA